MLLWSPRSCWKDSIHYLDLRTAGLSWIAGLSYYFVLLPYLGVCLENNATLRLTWQCCVLHLSCPSVSPCWDLNILCLAEYFMVISDFWVLNNVTLTLLKCPCSFRKASMPLRARYILRDISKRCGKCIRNLSLPRSFLLEGPDLFFMVFLIFYKRQICVPKEDQLNY